MNYNYKIGCWICCQDPLTYYLIEFDFGPKVKVYDTVAVMHFCFIQWILCVVKEGEIENVCSCNDLDNKIL